MASVLKVGAEVLSLLEDAPAFSTDIADEMETSEYLAGQRLRYLYEAGFITRRPFYVTDSKTKWLYLLPEHQPKLKESNND